MEQKKILVVGPSWVGDMMMSQVLLKVLKRRESNVVIDVLAPVWSFPLLERMPEVNKSIVMPIGHGQLKLSMRHQLGKRLKSEGYEEAFVLPNSYKSALVPFWAKIPKRTGWLGELRWGVLNDVRYLDKEKLPLMVQRYSALALSPYKPLPKKLPNPCFTIDPLSIEQAQKELKIKPCDEPILALCPGAEFGPSKRWPPQHFAEVAKAKLAQGWHVWLFGSPKDVGLAQEIQALTNHGCLDLVGKTSLPQAIDLLSTVSAVVTNDSGLMHIACALKKPLVALYGSTSPHFTPPLFERAKIISLDLECRPCFKRTCPLKHHHCLEKLAPQRVLEELTLMF